MAIGEGPVINGEEVHHEMNGKEEEPPFCAFVRELLRDDQAQKALKLADRALRDAVKRKDKRNEASARQMQVVALCSIPAEEPLDTVEVIKAALKALKAVQDSKGELWALRLQSELQAEALKADEAISTAKKLVKRCQELSDTAGEALGLLTVAEACANTRSSLEEGLEAANTALMVFGRVSDRCGQAACHQVLSDFARLEGDADMAVQAAMKALTLLQSAGENSHPPESRNITGIPGALHRKALALLAGGEAIEALRSAEKAAHMCLIAGDKSGEAQVLVALAEAKLAVCQGRSDDLSDVRHSILKISQTAVESVLRTRPHDRLSLAAALLNHSTTLAITGGLRSAVGVAKESMMHFRKVGDDEAVAHAQLIIADAEIRSGAAGPGREAAEEAFNAFKALGNYNGQDRALDLVDAANKVMGLPTRWELAAEERKKREEQLQLEQQQWAQQYYQQQPLQNVASPAPQPGMQQTLPGMQMQEASKAEQKPVAEFKRESDPIIASGMDMTTVKSKISSLASAIMGGEDEFEADTPLMEAGLTSNTAVLLRDELSKDLPGIKLPPTLIFDYPSVAAISDFVMDQSKMIAG